MTERDFIDQLCDLRAEWTEKRAGFHDSKLYYVDGADLGRELAIAALAGSTEPWVRAGFEVIERALVSGTPETQNLVVVGLFETMQGVAYHHDGPGDALDAWLGPRSQKAWADLIEGWTGNGIRTVDDWRRVVINGPRTRIVVTSEQLQFVATEADPDFAQIAAPLRPLHAVRIAERMPFGDMHAMVDTDGAQGPAMIMVGRDVGDGRIARCGERWCVIDYDALHRTWSALRGKRR